MHKQMAEVNGIAYSPYGEYSPPAHAAYTNGYESVYASTYANTAGYAAAAPVSYPSVQGQGYSIAQQVCLVSFWNRAICRFFSTYIIAKQNVSNSE